ncbi:MAG: DNA-binding protein [Thermoplasmatota archaeon]
MARMREVARRVFAVEYNRSQHEDRGLEENAPNYIITPLGATVNRVYFVGVMMTKSNTGSDDSPQYRVEVRDPTGTFYLYAGQYQPQALTAIGKLEPPALVGVVGKVRTFVKEDGTFYASVKPEVVFPVDIPQRDKWIVETSKYTMERLRAVKDAMTEDQPTVDSLMEKDHPRRAAEAGANAVGLYGNFDLTPYKEGVKDALSLVLEGGGKSVGVQKPAEEEGTSEEQDRKPVKEDLKEVILEIINELSGDKGALYRDIITKCEKSGVDKIQLEETIQELLDEGQIYEPTIGIIKPI